MEGFRVSPQQQRLWLLGASSDPAYSAALVARVAQPFDTARWKRAIGRLAERNELLRTRLVPVVGLRVPVQVVDAEPPEPAPFVIEAHPVGDAFDIRVEASAVMTDAPGLVSLVTELVALYSGGEPEETIQYCDLAEWLHQLLDDEEAEDAFRFWAARTGGFQVPPLHFVTRGEGAFAPHRVAVPVPSGLDAAVVVAAFSGLLSRLAGEPVTLGWTASGRAYDEVKGALGLLARVVPLALPAAGSLTERAAAAAREISSAEEMQGYYRLPDETQAMACVVDWLDLPEGVAEARAEVDRALVKLEGRARGGAVSLTLVADGACCDMDGVARLAEQLATLLAAAVAQPDAPLDALPVLGAVETARIAGFQGAVQPIPATTLDRMVAEVAARTPDAVAVEAEQGSLTYAQLDHRSEALAHVLAARLGPERRVVLAMERCLDMPVALLACFKAGAAYVPIDPDYPTDRIATMIEDSGASVILGTIAVPGREVLSLDGLDLDRVPAGDLPGTAPDQPAYVLYTSGSTGRPKGVVVRHRELVNHMRWMQRDYPLGPDDAVLQKTSFSFDASVWEFFAPLTAGARLVMARPGGQQDAPYLCDVLDSKRITVLQAVPTLLRMLLDTPDFARCALKRIFCGGEALASDLVSAVLKRGGCELVNLYGPTETTIEVAHWRCGTDDTVSAVPIGRPIDNVVLSVRDAAGAELPIGVVGELWIAGAAVSAGYHGQPAMTAERFVTLPSGGTAYRSGDLASWRPDGALLFHGRLDHQVKIRGFRIELGEIESVLRGHPEVRGAVALVEGAGGFEQIACVVEAQAGIDIAALRALVAARLPAYMAPSFITPIERFPLMPNGKIDRKALAGRRADDKLGRTPPRDDVELRLVEIWQRVLKCPVGVDDDFFALGGHSLLAVTLMSEVQKAFGHDLPLAVLFSAPTVADQAAILRQEAPQTTHAVVVPIQASGAKRRLFLVHPTGGNVLCYLDLARRLGPDQPIYALQDPGLFSAEPPYRTLAEMAALYVAAMREVQPQGPYYIGGWSSGGVVAFEMAQQLRHDGEEVGLLALIDSQANLEPDEAPDDHRLVNAVGRLLAYQANRDWEPLAPDTAAPQAVARLHELAEHANLVPPGAGQDYVLRLFNVFRSNVAAVSGYQAAPYPRRITLFRARDAMDEAIRHSAIHRPVDDPAHNWGRLGNVKVRTVPGDHLSMIAGANAESLGDALAEVIEETNRVYDLAGTTMYWMLGQ